MDLLQIAIAVSALLCSLVAGFLLAFAVVTMPGLGTLRDNEFLGAFKAIDHVIQDNQPVFMFVWVGSIAAVMLAAILSILWDDGAVRAGMVAAAAVYLMGVQVPTVSINIPLNNHLQETELQELDEVSLHELRERFEPRWTRWNGIRTVFAILTSGMLILLLCVS